MKNVNIVNSTDVQPTTIGESFLSSMFANSTSTNLQILDLSFTKTWAITSIGKNFLNGTYSACTGLTGTLNLKHLMNWNIATITDGFLTNCFYNCTSLTNSMDISGISNWPVTSIGTTFLSGLYWGCSKITNCVDLSAINNWKLTSLGISYLNQMYYLCPSLIDISKFIVPFKSKVITNLSSGAQTTIPLYYTFSLSTALGTSAAKCDVPKFADGTSVTTASSPTWSTHCFQNRDNLNGYSTMSSMWK